MLYQEVQGLSERMYILRLKVLKPNDLKTIYHTQQVQTSSQQKWNCKIKKEIIQSFKNLFSNP